MADELTIETRGLTKVYGGVTALAGLDLAVPKGSIYGVLGRNGAGKTTAIKILLGMARPTDGSAKVFGMSADAPSESVAIRRRIGFVSDEKDLYGSLTVAEMVAFTAAFYPTWRADLEHRYLTHFELPVNREVRALSRGMRAKLAVLLALSHEAELLILDEPTSGLDPAATEEVLQALVGHVASEGMTVFFSSHQIAEVEQIADHVAIIDHGRVPVSGPLDDIRARYSRVQLVFDGPAPPIEFTSPGVGRISSEGRVITVFVSQGADGVIAEAQRFEPVAVDVLPATLKDIFLETVVEGD